MGGHGGRVKLRGRRYLQVRLTQGGGEMEGSIKQQQDYESIQIRERPHGSKEGKRADATLQRDTPEEKTNSPKKRDENPDATRRMIPSR